MEIYIDHKRAAIKKGSSFEYCIDNRMFSGADGYTLNITFPLRGCPANTAIFGHINRADVTAQKVVFDCEIRDRYFHKYGCLTITQISDTEVQGQFLEGRSWQNFDISFDDVYINELYLGEPAITSSAQVSPEDAWNPERTGFEAVALPWFNNSDDGLPHNFAIIPEGETSYKWVKETFDEDDTSEGSSSSGGGTSSDGSRPGGTSNTTEYGDKIKLTWQPYLLHIAKRICEHERVGLSYDFAEWENSPFRYLIICNTLPDAWNIKGYGRTLPHWTVDEFFSKLELLLGGEFDIDYRNMHISFKFTNNTLLQTAPVRIENVVDEFSAEVDTQDANCDYLDAVNLAYKEPDYTNWKYQSCDWLIKLHKENAIVFDTLEEILNTLRSYRNMLPNSYRGDPYINNFYYAKDVDAYFVVRTINHYSYRILNVIGYAYHCVLQPINLLGGRIVDDDDDAGCNDIEIMPANIDYTEEKYGRCIFVECGSYDEEDEDGGRRSSDDEDTWWRTTYQKIVEGGEPDDLTEYFSDIYVAYWDGTLPGDGRLPYPTVEDIIIADDWSSYRIAPFSLRINNANSEYHKIIHSIAADRKYTFKILSKNGIPDVRAIFIIHGKQYVVEKVTATFTEEGMSQLIKVEAYPLAGQ